MSRKTKEVFNAGALLERFEALEQQVSRLRAEVRALNAGIKIVEVVEKDAPRSGWIRLP